MAKRRMFSLDVTDTDKFINMPLKSRYLYYELGVRADDDGFIGAPMKIVKMVGCTKKDLSILIERGFVLEFENGIIVITEWNMNNSVRKDMYHPTIYKDEFAQLVIIDGKYELLSATPGVTESVTDNVTDSVTGDVTRGEGSLVKGNLGEGEYTPARSFPSDSNSYLLLGKYQNVKLTEEEIDMLERDCPEWKLCMERLSEYMEINGKAYSNHYATICKWYREDHETGGQAQSSGSNISQAKKPHPEWPEGINSEEEFDAFIARLRE